MSAKFLSAPLVTLLLAVAPALLSSHPATLAGAAIWLGWLGTGLISASLLLTLRAPTFAGWFGGFERMYRWHHGFGTIGYATLLLHPLALAARSLPDDITGAWATLSPATQDWTGLLGWLALLGLMAGLGGTFLLRLPHRWWRRMHATLALAVLLGLGHTIAIGGMTASAWLVVMPAGVMLVSRIFRKSDKLEKTPSPHVATTTTHDSSPSSMRHLFLVTTTSFALAAVGLWFASLR